MKLGRCACPERFIAVAKLVVQVRHAMCLIRLTGCRVPAITGVIPVSAAEGRLRQCSQREIQSAVEKLLMLNLIVVFHGFHVLLKLVQINHKGLCERESAKCSGCTVRALSQEAIEKASHARLKH